jgi:antitoxin (DNA-binding transcriptional repressor) of toxin-antitoxin stability system
MDVCLVEETAMALTIDVTTLTEQLPQVLERVRANRESLIIEQDGKPLATLEPAAEPPGATAEQLMAALADLQMPDPDFADDLEQIQSTQPPAGFPEWRS